MPGANELSTVEWHSAQVMPTRVSVSLPLTVSTVPLRPTTASSLSSATVVAGLGEARCCRPGCRATTAGGSASASTFKPDRQRGRRIDRGCDHLVHAQRVGPVGLVAEGVEAEDLLALARPARPGVRRRRHRRRIRRRRRRGRARRAARRRAAGGVAARTLAGAWRAPGRLKTAPGRSMQHRKPAFRFIAPAGTPPRRTWCNTPLPSCKTFNAHAASKPPRVAAAQRRARAGSPVPAGVSPPR